MGESVRRRNLRRQRDSGVETSDPLEGLLSEGGTADEIQKEDDDDEEEEGKKLFIKELKNLSSKLRVQSQPRNQTKVPNMNVRERVKYSFALMGLFALILAMGPFYCDLLVLAITGLVYQEIVSLKRLESEHLHLPLFFSLRWFCFWLTLLTVAPTWFTSFFEKFIPFLSPRYKRLLSFVIVNSNLLLSSSYLIGFAGFIFSLRRYSLRYQFTQFSIMILTCFLVVGQFTFFVRTIHTGIAWFFLSTGAVICNDSFSYMVGKLIGRTKLTKLSPNKTVEGFFGGLIATIFWNLFVAWVFSHMPNLACPQLRLSLTPFSVWFAEPCQTVIFTPESLTLFGKVFFISPIYKHAISFALMASFFAPLGGLFASGFKRAVKIKDFGSLIPGHGGLTDRFDCQIAMAVLTSLYIQYIVGASPQFLPSVDLLVSVIRDLPPDQKARLLALSGLTTS